MAIWVAELKISAATRAKVGSKHGIDADELRVELQCVRGLRYWWDTDPERGRRAIVEVSIRDRTWWCVLYPRPDDVWHLGSAYPAD